MAHQLATIERMRCDTCEVQMIESVTIKEGRLLECPICRHNVSKVVKDFEFITTDEMDELLDDDDCADLVFDLPTMLNAFLSKKFPMGYCSKRGDGVICGTITEFRGAGDNAEVMVLLRGDRKASCRERV